MDLQGVSKTLEGVKACCASIEKLTNALGPGRQPPPGPAAAYITDLIHHLESLIQSVSHEAKDLAAAKGVYMKLGEQHEARTARLEAMIASLGQGSERQEKLEVQLRNMDAQLGKTDGSLDRNATTMPAGRGLPAEMTWQVVDRIEAKLGAVNTMQDQLNRLVGLPGMIKNLGRVVLETNEELKGARQRSERAGTTLVLSSPAVGQSQKRALPDSESVALAARPSQRPRIAISETPDRVAEGTSRTWGYAEASSQAGGLTSRKENEAGAIGKQIQPAAQSPVIIKNGDDDDEKKEGESQLDVQAVNNVYSRITFRNWGLNQLAVKSYVRKLLTKFLKNGHPTTGERWTDERIFLELFNSSPVRGIPSYYCPMVFLRNGFRGVDYGELGRPCLSCAKHRDGSFCARTTRDNYGVNAFTTQWKHLGKVIFEPRVVESSSGR